VTPDSVKVEEKTEPIRLVIGEDVFKAAVIRERKLTERSGLAMVLLMIGSEADKNSDSPVFWDDVSQALLAVKSDIDILGWFERRRSVGLIVPDVAPSILPSLCEQLALRIRQELTDRLKDEVASRTSIRLRVYPEPHRTGEGDCLSVDPFLYPDLNENRTGWFNYDVIKRGLDIIGSLTLLIALSPVFLLIAWLVKLTSRGPVLFRQLRVGQMMKPFKMIKFRTMYAEADHDIHYNYVSWFITASGKAEQPGKGKFFKLTNDSRITPIGHWLRKTSLDELPQLWNVLCGEMSLVGPRPPLWYELRQYQPWHRHRVLDAKPGISGLWQVSGRSRTTFDEMVRLDLRYARTRSLWTDIKILLATPAAVISGKGAG